MRSETHGLTWSNSTSASPRNCSGTWKQVQALYLLFPCFTPFIDRPLLPPSHPPSPRTHALGNVTTHAHKMGPSPRATSLVASVLNVPLLASIPPYPRLGPPCAHHETRRVRGVERDCIPDATHAAPPSQQAGALRARADRRTASPSRAAPPPASPGPPHRLPGPPLRLPGPPHRLPGPPRRLPGPPLRLPGPPLRRPGRSGGA